MGYNEKTVYKGVDGMQMHQELARARSQKAISTLGGRREKCWLSLEDPGALVGRALEENELQNASQEGAGEEKPKPLFLPSHLLPVPLIVEPEITGA